MQSMFFLYDAASYAYLFDLAEVKVLLPQHTNTLKTIKAEVLKVLQFDVFGIKTRDTQIKPLVCRFGICYVH